MENTRAKTTRNSLILLLTATIWGMAFVSQSKGMDYMHPFTFNGVRSLIGAAGILVYILISRKIAGDKAAKLDWKLNVRAGLLCGIFLTIASTLQQFGIKYTSVGIYHDPVYYFCAHVWHFFEEKGSTGGLGGSRHGSSGNVSALHDGIIVSGGRGYHGIFMCYCFCDTDHDG